jgi:hypothetical protein
MEGKPIAFWVMAEMVHLWPRTRVETVRRPMAHRVGDASPGFGVRTPALARPMASWSVCVVMPMSRLVALAVAVRGGVFPLFGVVAMFLGVSFVGVAFDSFLLAFLLFVDFQLVVVFVLVVVVIVFLEAGSLEERLAIGLRAVIVRGPALATATERRTLDFTGKRRSEQLFEPGLLLGRKHFVELFVSRLLQFGHFLARRFAVAVGTASKQLSHLLAHFGLRGFDGFHLLVAQLQGRGDFRIGQRLRSGLLPGNLLEPLALFGGENLGELFAL